MKISFLQQGTAVFVSFEIQNFKITMEAYKLLDTVTQISHTVKNKLVELDAIEPKCTGGKDPLTKSGRRACYCGHLPDCAVTIWQSKTRVKFY